MGARQPFQTDGACPGNDTGWVAAAWSERGCVTHRAGERPTPGPGPTQGSLLGSGPYRWSWVSVTRCLGLAARRRVGVGRPGREGRESLAVVLVTMFLLHTCRGSGWQRVWAAAGRLRGQGENGTGRSRKGTLRKHPVFVQGGVLGGLKILVWIIVPSITCTVSLGCMGPWDLFP